MESRNSIASMQGFPFDDWFGVAGDYPRHAATHRLFEEQVRRAPDAIAVTCAGASLTYSVLNNRANALARNLAAHGVEKGTPVGVCIERSLEMVIGLLAILKAGGAYVPLDATWPRERLAFVIADTQVPLILAQTRWRDAMSACDSAAVRMLFIDTENNSSGSGENLAVEVGAEDLAYIMFTSGSTGTPKGVAVPHRAVVRLVKNTNYADFSPDETFLQLAPVSFDASTFEIWGPLLNGGKLVVMPEGQPSLEEIGRTIREQGVTTLWLTAGLFNVMVDERVHDLQPLRQLLCGGEALSVPHVRRALRELKNTRLINGYGPTESTTFACCHTISPDENLDAGVPIGRPIANTTARILDENLQPVGIGVTGELFLGGDGLALGYWRSPELTAEKFIEWKGGRLYKTGDLARWRIDGVIEFLGRADDQIKLRGFRIELGEIETVLAQHPAVRDAVLVARPHHDDKELIAYFISDSQPQPGELTAWLREKLPDYMIPAAFVPMTAFPLTANGKVDRRALPEPPRTRTQNSVAPANATERIIFEVWRAVLRTDEIGVRDNFFELGGNSIRLVEVHARLVRALARPLPVTALLQHPTIGDLAKFLSADSGAGAAVSAMSERAQRQRQALARNGLARRAK